MPFLLWFSVLALPDLQLPRKMGAPKMLSNGRHSCWRDHSCAYQGLRGRAVDCHLHPHIMFETRVHNNFYLLRCDRLRNMELDSCGTAYAYRKQQPSLLRLEQCYSNCGCSNVNPHNTAPKPRTMVDHSLVARMMEQCTTRRQGEAGVLAPPLRP